MLPHCTKAKETAAAHEGKKTSTYNRRETERGGRQVGGRQFFQLSRLYSATLYFSVYSGGHLLSLCVSSSLTLSLSLPVCVDVAQSALPALSPPLCVFISLPLNVTPLPTLSSSSASGKHCMPLNHIYWAEAMCVSEYVCECFLIVPANISGGASLSLSLPASQLMWFGRPSCFYSIVLLTKNKNTHWPANSTAVSLPFVLNVWLDQEPNILWKKCDHR